MTKNLTFVTVVFEEEYLLLQLQARSMRLYLSPIMIDEIIIIDNSRRSMPQAFKDKLLVAYGQLAPLVTILLSKDICTIPNTKGWVSQQILKLMIAEHIDSEWYVALDSKNHFVKSPDKDFFLSLEGRARVSAYSYEAHPLRSKLERILTYLDLDPAPWISKFTATITPFVFNREIVLETIAEVELKSNNSFAEEFVKSNLTEFFLYSSYILRSGRKFEDVYDFDQYLCPIIWAHTAELNACQNRISYVKELEMPIFSIHRKALPLLCNDSMQTLALFWKERCLFDSVSAAIHFIHVNRRLIARETLKRQFRDIPDVISMLPYRLMRKCGWKINYLKS